MSCRDQSASWWGMARVTLAQGSRWGMPSETGSDSGESNCSINSSYCLWVSPVQRKSFPGIMSFNTLLLGRLLITLIFQKKKLRCRKLSSHTWKLLGFNCSNPIPGFRHNHYHEAQLQKSNWGWGPSVCKGGRVEQERWEQSVQSEGMTKGSTTWLG